MQAVQRAVEEFNKTSSISHRTVCGVGKKGRMVRFPAGNNTRRELTRIGPVINELFRGMASAIQIYEAQTPYAHRRASLAVGLASPDKLSEYCTTEGTERRAAKGIARGISVTKLGAVREKRRTSLIKETEFIPLIGEGANIAFQKINDLFDAGERVVKIRGLSPVNEVIAKKMLERDDVQTACVVRPEGQDALYEYRTLSQIFIGIKERESSGGQIAMDEGDMPMYQALTEGIDKKIEEEFIKYLSQIIADQDEGLEICILGAESMDEGSRTILENAIRKINSDKLKLIVVGIDTENPSIPEELTETISKEETKDLVAYVLSERIGGSDTLLISESDAEKIVMSMPKILIGPEGAQVEKIRGAEVKDWVGDLIAAGHLHPGGEEGEAAWEVSPTISQVRLEENSILARKLNTLERELKGITEVAYAIAAAGRPIQPEELDVPMGSRTNCATKLAMQGIVLKVDVMDEGKKAGLTVGQEGYIIAPQYKQAVEVCMEGWGERRAEVHKKILRDLAQDPSQLVTQTFEGEGEEGPAAKKERLDNNKKTRNFRTMCSMHYSEHFKYYEENMLDADSIKWLGEYLQILRIEAIEELADKNNRAKASHKLKALFDLEGIFGKLATDDVRHIFLDVKEQYLELLSIFSGAAQRSQTNKDLLFGLTEEDSILFRTANNLNFLRPEKRARTDVIAGLTCLRAGRIQIREITTPVRVSSVKEAKKHALKHGTALQIKELIKKMETTLEEHVIPYAKNEGFEDLETQLRIFNALQVSAIIYWEAGSMLGKLKDASYIKYLETGSELCRKTLDSMAEFEPALETETQKRAFKVVQSDLKNTLKTKMATAKAEGEGLTVEGMLEFEQHGQISPPNKKFEAEIEQGVLSLLSIMFDKESGDCARSLAIRLEDDPDFGALEKKIHSLIEQKQRSSETGEPWKKPKWLTSALLEFSENARTLARTYRRLDGPYVNGIERSEAHRNLLDKALKAAELTRILNDYPNEQGEFFYDFVPVYNSIEAWIEIAAIAEVDSPEAQKGFDMQLSELVKLWDTHGDVFHGIPLKSEVFKLCKWGLKAGLTVPDEYKAKPKPVEAPAPIPETHVEAPRADEAQVMDVIDWPDFDDETEGGEPEHDENDVTSYEIEVGDEEIPSHSPAPEKVRDEDGDTLYGVEIEDEE